MLSATSITALSPKRSQRTSICSAMSFIPSNMARRPSGPKAGIKRRCALAQFGSLVSAVNNPSPAKSPTICRPFEIFLPKRLSSQTSFTSSCELRKAGVRPPRDRRKIGPWMRASCIRLCIGTCVSMSGRLPRNGKGFGCGMTRDREVIGLLPLPPPGRSAGPLPTVEE
jgi:hypothetical protein